MENTDSKLKQDEFMELYQPLHNRLSRFVHSMVWNAEDARDVIGETVLVAWESFHKLRDRNSFLYYLFGIASRLAKKRDRRKKFTGIFDIGSASLLAAPHRSDERAENNELHAALNKLPLRQREAITLFEISGFQIKEIAELQGDSISAVKSRMLRAREALQKLLSDEPRVPHSMQSIALGAKPFIS